MARSNILIKSKIKKASKLILEGKLEEARTIYLQLYTANKSNSEIALELAIIYRKLGDFKAAESISKDILKDQPENTTAHLVYGTALQCMKQMEMAIKAYQAAIKLTPNHAHAHYFLGNAYQLTGRTELAVEQLKKAVEINPQFYEALNNLGAALIDLHRPVEARDFLDKASKIDPDSCQLLCNLAAFYQLEQNNSEKTFLYANKAYLLNPNFLDAIKLLGRFYFQKPDYDKALEFYRKAYAQNNDSEIAGYIAQILERRGEFDAALKLVEPFIQIGDTHYASLLAYSALSRHFKNQHTAIRLIEKKIEMAPMDKSSLIKLHSELGKQYDSLKDYNHAFNNYQKANLLDRELNWELQKLNKSREINNTGYKDIDNWFSDYPADFWSNLPLSGNNSSRPIFVIGMFRSGTTLCEQILSSHPEIEAAGELHDINSISYSLGNSKSHDKSPASLKKLTQKQLADAATSYLKTLDTYSTTAKHVVDKMPANFFHLGLISRIFPNAHIIHMVRDPRDVCLSMYFQRFDSQMIWSTDLEELADYHLAYQRIMEYWHEVLDIEILDVVYEELMENQEAMTRRMLDFCGLEWNQACLNFHKNKRDVNTPSYDQVRKPLYKKSVARWKNYEPHIQPLLDKLKASRPMFLRNE